MWQYDEQAKESRAKRWDTENNTNEKVESISMLNEHDCSLKKQNLSENCAGVLGVFSKGVSRIIEDNRDFTSIPQHQDEGKFLKHEIVQAIKAKEAIAAAGAWYKDGYAEVSLAIEYGFEIETHESSTWSSEWKHNASAVSEALIVLDLAQAVDRSMRNGN